MDEWCIPNWWCVSVHCQWEWICCIAVWTKVHLIMLSHDVSTCLMLLCWECFRPVENASGQCRIAWGCRGMSGTRTCEPLVGSQAVSHHGLLAYCCADCWQLLALSVEYTRPGECLARSTRFVWAVKNSNGVWATVWQVMPPCFQQVSLDDGLGHSALGALLLLSLHCLAISVSQTHKCSSMAADLARSHSIAA